MTTRPSLLRSIPFWLLIVLSLATVVYGAWLFIVTTGSMTTGLAAQTATTADVYVGQIIAIIGGILIGTGLLLAVEVVQIGVGLWQARTGLPVLLVGIHMVLAVLLVAAMTVVVMHLTKRAGTRVS